MLALAAVGADGTLSVRADRRWHVSAHVAQCHLELGWAHAGVATGTPFEVRWEHCAEVVDWALAMLGISGAAGITISGMLRERREPPEKYLRK